MMPPQPCWLRPHNWRETDGDWSCRSRHPPLVGQGVLRALLALILDRIFGRNGPRKFNHNAPTKRRADLPNTPTEVRKRFGAKSGSCGVRQCAEYRENERFALEVVGLNIARGAIDLFPGIRDPCHLRFGVGNLAKSRRQPTVDQVHEGFQRLRIVAADGFAESMQRAGVGSWLLRKQCE